MRGTSSALTLAGMAAAGLFATAGTAGATITPIPTPHNSAGAAGAVRLAADVPANFPTVGAATFYAAPNSKTLQVPPSGNPVSKLA